MEKKRPTYNLREIKEAFDCVSKLRMTLTAKKCIRHWDLAIVMWLVPYKP